MSRRSACCVFVGNIPYDATEEQLIEIFQEVGPVVSFRLVFDRETGKPKGYGFCEYRDADTALSAMRNHKLNGHDFNGRSLRVDYAEAEKAHMQRELGQIPTPSQRPPPDARGAPPGVPRTIQGQPIPNMASQPSTAETINTMIEGMSTAQLYDLVAKTKAAIQQNPEQVKQALNANPPFAYALLKAQALLGMVNYQTVQNLMAKPPGVQLPVNVPPMQIPQGAPTIAPGFIPPYGQPIKSAGFVQQPNIQLPQQPNIQMQPGITLPQGMQLPVAGMQLPPQLPPGVQLQSMGLPQTMYPVQQQIAADPQVEQQKALLQQVMSLTQDQIDKLPPEQRQQVQQVRNLVFRYQQQQ